MQVSEDAVADALEFGHEQIKHIIKAIQQLHDKVKPNKVTVPRVALRRISRQGNRTEIRREAA